MKVLIACEYSGTVRDAFIKQGHEAISCDLLPTESEGPHYQGDVFDIINEGWDLMIAHPPCTYLTCTGNKWFKPEFKTRFPDREKQREEAVEFFIKLYEAPIKRIAIENPVGIMSSRLRKPNQYIQPYMFGDPQRKKTGLWLKNLLNLIPTNIVEPKLHTCKNGYKEPMWHMDTMNLPKEERSKLRSKTYQGIADAMATQWG